jgi:hypothetical protein
MTTTKSYDFLNRLTGILNLPTADAAGVFNYANNDANQRTSITNLDGYHVMNPGDRRAMRSQNTSQYKSNPDLAGTIQKENHRWTQMNTDKEAFESGPRLQNCVHHSVSEFFGNGSNLHLCLSVFICGYSSCERNSRMNSSPSERASRAATTAVECGDLSLLWTGDLSLCHGDARSICLTARWTRACLTDKSARQ